MYEINKTCPELASGSRFNYSIPVQDSQPRADCEYAWKAQNGTVLRYGRFLLHDFCENGIHLVETCFSPSSKKTFTFNVLNTPAPIKGATEPSHKLMPTVMPKTPNSSLIEGIVIGAVLLILLILLIVLFCYCKRRMLAAGVFSRLMSGCRRGANVNNDPNPADQQTSVDVPMLNGDVNMNGDQEARQEQN